MVWVAPKRTPGSRLLVAASTAMTGMLSKDAGIELRLPLLLRTLVAWRSPWT